MSSSAQETTTRMLADLRSGNGSAADQLLPLVYDELRAIAANYFSRQSADHTLQPTALVHEVFLRLVDPACVQIKDRSHFFALAARAMRQILVDHARRKHATKRGGAMHEVPLEEVAAPDSMPPVDLVALDDALLRLRLRPDRQRVGDVLGMRGEGPAHSSSKRAKRPNSDMSSVDFGWRRCGARYDGGHGPERDMRSAAANQSVWKGALND